MDSYIEKSFEVNGRKYRIYSHICFGEAVSAQLINHRGKVLGATYKDMKRKTPYAKLHGIGLAGAINDAVRSKNLTAEEAEAVRVEAMRMLGYEPVEVGIPVALPAPQKVEAEK